MVAHQDLTRGDPPSTGSSTTGATVSGEQRISGAQSASRGETAIRVNRWEPRRIVAASKNLPPGVPQQLYSGAQMAIFYSSDGGASWGQSYLPWAAGDAYMGDPSVDWTSDGTAWATIIGVPGGNSLVVRAYRSTDGGATWTLDSSLPPLGGDKEMMWVDHSATSPFKDNIYVIWDVGGPAMVARRNAATGTWQTPIQVGLGVGTDVKTNQYGDVFAFLPNRQLSVARSTDGGTSFGSPVDIATTFASEIRLGVPANNGRGVLVYLVGGAWRTAIRNEVYAAWNDLSGDPGCTSGIGPGSDARSTCKTRIFFSRSTDGGATWSVPIKINDPAALDDQFYPWLVVDDATGRLAVSYYDTAGDASRTSVNVYYQSSADGGQSWNSPIKVTSAATNETTAGASWFQFGEYAGMDGYGGVFFPAWTDRRSGGPEEIWTAAIRDGDGGLFFYTVPPCRVLDTRDGTPLTSAKTTLVQVAGRCGIPADAKAVSANWTIVQPQGQGFLTVYPGDGQVPPTSTLNYGPGQVRANNGMALLAGDGSGTVHALATVSGGGTTDLILDVNGYFK
jgi:BNR/Asp-box repeat